MRSKKGEGEEDITVRVGRAHGESRQCSVGVGYRMLRLRPDLGILIWGK